MSDWIKLASGTMVNLDRVDCIVSTNNGARIIFTGTEDDSITAPESPDEIMAMPRVRKDA